MIIINASAVVARVSAETCARAIFQRGQHAGALVGVELRAEPHLSVISVVVLDRAAPIGVLDGLADLSELPAQ